MIFGMHNRLAGQAQPPHIRRDRLAVGHVAQRARHQRAQLRRRQRLALLLLLTGRRTQSDVDAAMVGCSWRACVGLVRVRDWDLDTRVAAAAVRRAAELKQAAPTAPFLILTAGFMPSACPGGPAVQGERDPWAFIEKVIYNMVTHTYSCTPVFDKYSNMVFLPSPSTL